MKAQVSFNEKETKELIKEALIARGFKVNDLIINQHVIVEDCSLEEWDTGYSDPREYQAPWIDIDVTIDLPEDFCKYPK